MSSLLDLCSWCRMNQHRRCSGERVYCKCPCLKPGERPGRPRPLDQDPLFHVAVIVLDGPTPP